MAINPQTAAIIGGAAFGGYTSDIIENPVSGLISTGIGAGMGAFMRLPEASFKDMAKVAVGPTIDMNMVNNAQAPSVQNFEDFIVDFRDKINKRLPSVLTYNTKVDKINNAFNTYSDGIRQRVQEEVLRKSGKSNEYFDRKMQKRIDKITSQIESRNSHIRSIIDDRQIRRTAGFYERAANREANAVSRYMDSPRGLAEVSRYDSWINTQKKSRKHLIGKSTDEIREELFDEYLKKHPRSFSGLRSIRDRYNDRVIKDKKDLFNPWHFDLVNSESTDLETRIQLNNTYLKSEVDKIKKGIAQERQSSLDFNSDKINTYYEREISSEKRLRDSRLLKLERKFNDRFQMMDKIHSVLKNAGVNIPNDHKQVIDYLNQTTNESILRRVDDLVSNPSMEYVNLNTIKIDRFKSTSKQLKGENAEKGLVEYFTKNLGNNIEDAQIKAKMFLDRAVGGNIQLKDGTISFTDVDQKRVSVPLTSYSNGVRYHNQGDGVYSIAKQFNPYGLGYLGGNEVQIGGEFRKVTATDVIKGFDPEMMISFLDRDTPISSILGNIKSLYHYDSKDTGVRFKGSSSDFISSSDKFLNQQGMIDLSVGLNYNEFGEVNPKFPFRKLKAESGEGIASERVRLLKDKLGLELPPDMAGHLFDGVSMNDLTSINTRGFNSFAAFAPLERNETSVGNRDTLVVNKNSYTKGLEDLMGAEHFGKQFSSSQVVRKLDVQDSKLFNEITSTLFGNDYVLSDGGGFFNMSNPDFKVKDTSTIKLPIIGSTDLKITHPELAVGLRSQQGITEYVKNNPISITNKPIAYDSLGRPIALKNQYTSGKIVDAYSTGKDFRLIVESEFDPNVERNMKFFSTGTKSLNTGVTENNMNLLAEIGTMLNEGAISRNSQGYVLLNGKYVNNDVGAIKREAQFRINRAKSNGTHIPVSLIGAASDTGTETIMHAIRGGLQGNAIYDALIDQGGSKEISALTALMFTEHKAAVDLTATIGVGLDQYREQFRKADAMASLTGSLEVTDPSVKPLIDNGLLKARGSTVTLEDITKHRQAFNKNFLQTFSADSFLKNGMTTPFLRTAYDLVEKSGAVHLYKSGIGFAIGSMNKGMSIVGAGNRAGMSWNARANLLSSGFTNENLNLFGSKSDRLLYEIRSVMSERNKSPTSINRIINNQESRFLGMLYNTPHAEDRLEMLGKLDTIDNAIRNSPFLSYNLTYSDHDIKSINFSRISTKRSGMFEKDSGVGHMLKDLDKYKADVVFADTAYRNAKTETEKATTKQGIIDALNTYDEHVKSMFSGDNNLLKSALSLESQHSDIMQVKGIGGSAERFANKMMSKENGYQNIWFLSEEEALHKAKQINGNLEFRDVKGYNNIKQPVIVKNGQDIPLSSLLTREPAQGPLSSDLVQWYVDKSIQSGNRGNAFVSNSSLIYSKGMFGDMDQDTVQTLLGNFNNRSEFDEIEGKRKIVRSTFTDMEGILNAMKIKNSNQKQKTLADFEGNPFAYASYRISSALKGRNRKTLAAASTGLAVAYSKALELEFGHLGVNNKSLLEGRIIGHQLIENLLKSAHLDTDAFGQEQEQVVEKLNRLRNGYLGKPKYTTITAKEYESGLREELPKFLNLHSMKDGVNKDRLSGIIDNIVTSEINHSVKVGRNPLTPLDLPEHRYSKDSKAYIEALESIVENSSITNIDYEDASKHLRKASGQLYSGVSDLIFDTLKNNKLVIGGGLAAMAGVAILGRQDPQFTDSRTNSRQHAATMLRSSGEYDAPSINNTPMGQDTNTNKSGYLTPKTFGAKGIRVSGDFVSESEDQYNNFNSMISTDNVEQQAYNMTSALFGDGIRSARLQTNN